MATKNIGELTEDELMRILGPDSGSDRDGSRVALGRSNRDSCVSMVDGKLQVKGSDEFRRSVEAAFEAKKAPSSGFGYAPYRPVELVEPEPTIKLMPKTDTTSATKVNVPILVYQSPRKPGLNADGSKAADMVYGKMSAEDIKKIPTKFGTKMFDLNDPATADPANHFKDLRNMATLLFSTGEMKFVVLAMIAKFERSEGGEFRHPILTQEARAHVNTQLFVKKLLTGINSHIKASKGNLNPESLAAWMSEYPGLKPPRFHNAGDFFTGLTMAVNDVWGAKAEIVSYEQYGNHYKGRVLVTLYDHFGLDYPDVGPDPDSGQVKPYGLLAGFRSWFVLQHYKKFAYKPFVSVMEMNYQIEGDI